MPLKFYNTLSHSKEIFKPIKKPYVGLYTCGPTVYWNQHIGNMRGFLSWDLLKRVLEFNGYKVKHVINITDVGHLTSDADTGEDKMEQAVKREGKKAKVIANYYFDIFKKDIKKLNIISPNFWTKATEHIKEQINLIKTLEKKGYTYKTNDGIYFDTSKLKNYGKLAKNKIKNLKAGKRVSLGDKKNKTDFALWKFSKKEEKRQQEWESPWGIGFPGWHLECSAMSMKYLGEHFDIHTGGQEHIQIHHTNEIAQSEASTGKKFVNYWLHNAWLLFKGEKMSKSKGGVWTISDLEKKGFAPLEFRYLILGTHYKKPLNFTREKLESARNSYKRLKNIISQIKDDNKTNKKYFSEFKEAINDDLNMPEALRVLWKFIRDEKAAGKIKTIKKIDEVFGLDLLKKEKLKIPKEVQKLVKEREKLRKAKEWGKSDKLRDKINKLGYSIDDTKEGTTIKKI